MSDKPVDAIEGKHKLNISGPVLVYLFKEGDLAMQWYHARNMTDYEKTQIWSSKIWKPLSTLISSSPRIGILPTSNSGFSMAAKRTA